MMSAEIHSLIPRNSGGHFDYIQAMEYLVDVVQQLSLARDLNCITEIVKRAARQLTGADGATIVLRDGDECFYVDEDSIAPLWKGSRFPMRACVSGWVMVNCQPAVIEDIYSDARVPLDAYRPTFVRSMAMVPIGTLRPAGAIGTYWATSHMPSPDQMKLLRALADTTAVVLENVQFYQTLENRVRERTAQLEAANREIHQLSLTDELTGLHNRRGFLVLATQQLRAARRAGSHAWLLFADVDGLKPVNDRLGHKAGDRLLCAAARALKDSFRDLDVVARIGGDEFAVFGVTEQRPESMLKRLQARIAKYNVRCEEGLQLSLSTGLVQCESCRNVSIEKLLTHADEVMYDVKRTRTGVSRMAKSVASVA